MGTDTDKFVALGVKN